MKLKINRKDLAKHISIVQKAISTRTTMQILEGILLIAKDNMLTLISSDEKLSIKTNLSTIINEEGSCVVNARLFGEIIRKLPDDTLDITVKNHNMNIKAEKSNFNIQVQNASEFPNLPNIEDDSSIQINSESFIDAIRKTSFAVSLDETRKNFTGVFMNVESGSISFVALDGFRMALKSIKNGTDKEISAIIPARALNEIVKIIEDEESVEIVVSDNQIKFVLKDTEVYSTRISGEFFNYEGLIRNDHSFICNTNREEFQNALERASLLAKEEKANLVKLEVCENSILISSNSEIGSVEENVESENNAHDLKIAFNSKYLLEGIRNMTSEKIGLNFTDSVNPCIIKEDDDKDYIYLVLPVRLAN